MSPFLTQLEGFTSQNHGYGKVSLFRRLLSRPNSPTPSSPTLSETGADQQKPSDENAKSGFMRRLSRKVVPGLPRNQTFKRQQEERREHLTPIEPSHEERRTVSMDRRSHLTAEHAASSAQANPRASAPSLMGDGHLDETASHRSYTHSIQDESLPAYAQQESLAYSSQRTTSERSGSTYDECDDESAIDQSYEDKIVEELEHVWILNLSMHFRDRSNREKFFVTYRQPGQSCWRRVTVSLDYRDAQPLSLESELRDKRFQRDKSAEIYKAIRDSLSEIQFYETVTNLKLETTDGRLHVHVVEDGNEIITYPTVSQIRHLGCQRIRERDIMFESHMSGFVYKVRVQGQALIKKEIPSPDTVEEFLYEVNALNNLRFSRNVIQFHGVVVDDDDTFVKGLLINYADQGALVDIIYDAKDLHGGLPWDIREKWARQIIQGLSDIHESGFVQGDFTLSNIVIDDANDAKIIDINRRGCPLGWEPPEATALSESGQRLSMYIGVKSDLYQLGMVLWGLAMLVDEPEAQGRPLVLGPEMGVPDWYRQITEICLSSDPRKRKHAISLLDMFPAVSNSAESLGEGGQEMTDYFVESHGISAPVPVHGWSTNLGHGPWIQDNHYYPTRGRSPPSPLPSNYSGCDLPEEPYSRTSWAANNQIPASYSDSGEECDDEGEGEDEGKDEGNDHVSREPTPTPTAERTFNFGPGNTSQTSSSISGSHELEARSGSLDSPHDFDRDDEELYMAVDDECTSVSQDEPVTVARNGLATEETVILVHDNFHDDAHDEVTRHITLNVEKLDETDGMEGPASAYQGCERPALGTGRKRITAIFNGDEKKELQMKLEADIASISQECLKNGAEDVQNVLNAGPIRIEVGDYDDEMKRTVDIPPQQPRVMLPVSNVIGSEAKLEKSGYETEVDGMEKADFDSEQEREAEYTTSQRHSTAEIKAEMSREPTFRPNVAGLGPSWPQSKDGSVDEVSESEASAPPHGGSWREESMVSLTGIGAIHTNTDELRSTTSLTDQDFEMLP